MTALYNPNHNYYLERKENIGDRELVMGMHAYKSLNRKLRHQ